MVQSQSVPISEHRPCSEVAVAVAESGYSTGNWPGALDRVSA